MTDLAVRDGGLDWSLDLALVEAHPDPQTFETFNVWLTDGEQEIGLNLHLFYVRGGIARERATLFLPDKRTLSILSEGDYDRGDAPGGSSIFYHCAEPFHQWNYRWVAPSFVTSEQDEAAGCVQDEDLPTLSVSAAIEAETVTEPWIIPLSTGPSSLAGPARLEKGIMLGKYEQLLRGTGEIVVGRERWAFDGVGLRGHVRGPRDTTGMGSHAWVCGYFPSGRGFCIKILFNEAGKAYFSEAYVSQGSRITRADILEAPAFERDPKVRDFSVRLRADGEDMLIRGTKFHTTWIPLGGWENGAARAGGGGAFASGHGLAEHARKIMSQSCARFDWDGETGSGMCELSG